MILSEFQHSPGEHCGSTSLRNLSDFYDWDLDEPECFGLASGLGFTYLELPVEPWRAFFGRPKWLERAFFENLGIPHTHTKGDDWEAAWSAVTDRLDAGDPVMLFVDLYYLDYYGTDTHFAPHSLLLVGYDDADDVAYVADNEFDEVQALPTSSLQDAWSSKAMLPLEHRYLVVEDATFDTSLDAAAATAVEETATFMLDPDDADRTPMPYGTHGIEGIRTMAEDIQVWATHEEADWILRFAYQNIERRGTGGGLFRRLYASFLDQRGRDIGLADGGDRMATIADQWTEIATRLLEASEMDEPTDRESVLADVAARTTDLADRESQFYREVRTS